MAGSWRQAAEQIGLGAKRQFDPDVVEAFRARELAMLRLHRELDDSAQPPIFH
jgi:response regulator RpfG family c-di-GMP phosphodiesterase